MFFTNYLNEKKVSFYFIYFVNIDYEFENLTYWSIYDIKSISLLVLRIIVCTPKIVVHHIVY